MKLRDTHLNIVLSVIIILLVTYFSYINFNYEKENETLREGNIGRKIRKTVKKATKPVKKQLTYQMKKIEKKMKRNMQKAIKKSTKPIIKIIDVILKQLKSIINGIKSGIVTPLVNVFKNIGLMFAELGLLIFDFLLKIAEAPMCLISYIIWVINTVRVQIFTGVIFPIIKMIIKKIMGRFYPETIIGLLIKFLSWYINFPFYIISMMASFLGVKEFFYKDKCFNFTEMFKKRIDNMRKHLVKSGNSFTQFGKFNF